MIIAVFSSSIYLWPNSSYNILIPPIPLLFIRICMLILSDWAEHWMSNNWYGCWSVCNLQIKQTQKEDNFLFSLTWQGRKRFYITSNKLKSKGKSNTPGPIHNRIFSINNRHRHNMKIGVNLYFENIKWV